MEITHFLAETNSLTNFGMEIRELKIVVSLCRSKSMAFLQLGRDNIALT